MARPKKTSVTLQETASVDAFRHTHGDPLPARIDLLQELVCALLNRMQRMDAETLRQVAVFVRVLAARSAYWERARSTQHQDVIEVNREWKDYRKLLSEIALGKKTKLTHCGESVIDHGRLLDHYLAQHSDFSTCRNWVTTREWITKHEQAILDLLLPIPCFCSYGDALMPATFSKPLKQAMSGRLTQGRFRDILLSLLHCTTHAQIAKIRKGASSFTTDKLLYRPLDAVLAFPSDSPLTFLLS
jgi:hypothetical protein